MKTKLELVAITIVLPTSWIAFLGSLWYALKFNAFYVQLVSNASYVYTNPHLNMNIYLQQRMLLCGIVLLGFFMILKLIVLLRSEGNQAYQIVVTALVAVLLAVAGIYAINSYAHAKYISDKPQNDVVTILKKFSDRIDESEKTSQGAASKSRTMSKAERVAAVDFAKDAYKQFLEESLHSMSNLSTLLTNWALLLLTAVGGLFAFEVGYGKK